uniref:DNA replication complex GINS protein PSF2 n=1 Tax=Physcomitrium patens TaxID=3218 RepID=A0A7I4CQ34_PHYPA
MAGQGPSEPALFTELEVEFMAEDEPVNIIPNVRMDTLHMICGDYGPFRPQIPITVPLWLGIAMKKRSKCRIQPPGWMSVERLTEVLEMEREAPREFQPLPFHYVEIAKLLLDNAREDFENNYMVQSLLEDIKDVRWDKVEKAEKSFCYGS